jgi:hypothetical protein
MFDFIMNGIASPAKGGVAMTPERVFQLLENNNPAGILPRFQILEPLIDFLQAMRLLVFVQNSRLRFHPFPPSK